MISSGDLTQSPVQSDYGIPNILSNIIQSKLFGFEFPLSFTNHVYIYIYIYYIMWQKQCHKPPMTGNGNHTTYKNVDDWGMVYGIVLPTWFPIKNSNGCPANSEDQTCEPHTPRAQKACDRTGQVLQSASWGRPSYKLSWFINPEIWDPD